MASQGNNVHYDPLPLTSDDHPATGLYNAPPSPDPHISTFHTPLSGPPRDLPPDLGDLPPGAGTPRFLGAALYDDGSAPMRNSYASSHNTGPGSEYNGSLYALNDSLGQTARLTDSHYGGYRDDPNAPFGEHGTAMDDLRQPRGRLMAEKTAIYAAPREKSRRKILILSIIAGLILIAAAVILPIYFLVIKNNGNKNGSSGSSDHTGTAQPTSTSKPNTLAVTGTDGSKVTMDDGSTFTYSNKLGGSWYWDENDPFNNGARAQSFSPALNETFKYGIDQIRGVNLGGWLNTEPFISPALYEKYHTDANPCVDEWDLSQHMRNDTAGGGINQLEDHYKTFITEKDFAEIAGAGLNYVRIPIGWWAIETRDDEPFLEGVSWQ
jgi:glucan 1,3-beta-glucosidase